MGRQGNGKLISAGHKAGTRTAGLLPPSNPRGSALKKLLSKPVMKEIKPVAAKKSGSRKKLKTTKRRATTARPTKAVPSKKIASSPKVPATRAKVPVKPVKTNDPPPVTTVAPIAPPEPVVVVTPDIKPRPVVAREDAMAQATSETAPPPIPVSEPTQPAPSTPEQRKMNFVLPPIPETAKRDETPQPPPVPVSQLADSGITQPPPEPIHAPHPPMLFECAWEVCWQLGGIYTVLRSKAAAMQTRWGDNYCLIGPYNPATAAMEFEERATEGVVREVLDRLRNQGIACHYGRWLIPGRPRVILLDYRGRFSRLGEDKYLMWADHGISIPPSDGEVNEVVAFGFTVTEFFRELSNLMTDRPILAHFHEWMAGVAVPRIARLRLPVTTVFTTHATLLGRYIAGDDPYFYQHLPYLNGDEQAAKYLILAKHQIEKAGAHAATVFTTVSEVTAVEARQLLGRQADVILPNGLNIQKFAALHEFQNLHRAYKERINEFVMGHFFPSYTFDLDKTLYFFTSGRYEYRNKGLDMYIEALFRLNQRLRTWPDPPNIVAFIITRAPTRNINVGALQAQAMFDELKAISRDIERQMGKRLFLSATTGRFPTFNELLPDEAQVRLKRAMHVWRSARQPPIVTHDLHDDAGDAVLRHLRHRRLFNAADDPVKMVFHPEFLSATTPPLNLDYDNFVRGCHLGVFTSYYEPWGYTPMESIALGVPAVTTDLSGFGAYVQRHVPHHEDRGVLVLNRGSKSFEDATEDLVNYLVNFARLNRRQRIELRNRVERLGEMFDWSVLVRHYHEAHDLALERTHGVRPGKLELKVI